MKHTAWTSLLGSWALTVASLGLVTACSGNQDEAEQVAPDSANNGDDKVADAPSEETTSEGKAAAESTAAAAEGESSDSTAAASDEGGTSTASDAVASSDEEGETASAVPTAAPAAAEAAASPGAMAAASAVPAAAATPAPAPAAHEGGGASTAAAGPGGRVVRFIKADQTELHQAASDTSPVAMRMAQGDVLMVVEEGGWGRISDELFVRLDQVANRAVPRLFAKPVWQAPAH